VQPRAGNLGKRNIPRNGERFCFRRGGGKAKPGRHLARRGDGVAGQPRILGMGADHEVEHGGILQDAQHDARIGDPATPGRDRLCACIPHQPEFGEAQAF